jgi:NADH dehydrogenase [ubiquinone] 1 alpha subcomplex assembly factor 1
MAMRGIWVAALLSACVIAPAPTTAKVPPEVDGPARIMMETALFDFDSPAELRAWFNQDDPVMGGLSRSTAGNGEPSVLAFAGVVRLENNGGFAAIRGRADDAQRNIADRTAIRLRVRGDGKTYGFTMSKANQSNVLWQARFSTRAGAWEEITLPFSAFSPSRFGRDLSLGAFDGRDVALYGFIISDKQSGPFALDVDWIRAVAR